MSFHRDDTGKDIIRLPRAAVDLLDRLQITAEADLVAAIEIVLLQARPIEVVDLWEQRQAALTYWVLLLTGVNQEDEMRIAKDLLAWQSFFSKDSARVLCIQSSEREQFHCCSRAFNIHNFPTLIFSDSPDMHTYIRVEPGLLTSLSEQPGGLQTFFAKIQSMVENGMTLQQVQDKMVAETFWRGIKVVYKEVKGLVSIQVGG